MRQVGPWLLAVVMAQASSRVSAATPEGGIRPPAAVPAAPSTDEEIARLQAQLRKGPETVRTLEALASACLQKIRETGDPSWLGRADEALQRASRLDPKDTGVLVSTAILRLARHDFSGALSLADQILATEPRHANARLLRLDALVELGRYDDVGPALQTILRESPSPWSIARAAFFREMHGDVAGAEKMMRVAVSASRGSRHPENEAWARSQLAALLILQGRVDEAEAEYRQAIVLFPGYVHGLAGLARIAAVRGRWDESARLYAEAVRAMPIGEYVIALGEVLAQGGRPEEAGRQFALIDAMTRLYRAGGVDMDLEMAQFDADHGRHLETTVADARAGYARRPSVKAADVLGWLLYRSGRPDEALPLARAAVRLGTRDPVVLFHTGMVEAAAGDKAAARAALSAALAPEPRLLGIHAVEASRVLAELGGPGVVADGAP